jgi:hypothetical protein
MATPAHLTNSIKRLCDLELGCGTLVTALSETEKHIEITKLRSTIPASILGHHDRMLQRGKRSIVPVVNGVCSACHLRLPMGHVARLQTSQDLEVCDNCSTFIYLERTSEPRVSVNSKPAKAKPKRRKRAVQ